MTTSTDRLMILGLDGATFSVLDPMRQRGLMPNLDALLRRSAHGTLRSTIPPVTTAAWTTFMTGVSPWKHGVFDHRYYHAETQQMKVNHSGRCRVPTFWHLASDAGRSVVSLNLPGTFPPLNVRGVVVSGMDAPHLEAATSACPEFARKLRAEVPDYSLRYFWKRVPESLDELVTNARLTAESFLGRAGGGELADREVPDWSVLMVQFQNLDPFQHRCWRFLNVDETGLDQREWTRASEIVIKGLDEAIGRLCDLADRRGASILAASDHGFGPCLGRISVNRILIDAGLARPLGLGGKLARRVSVGIEKLRTEARKRDDPNARSASFASSVHANLPLDWSRTVAFAPHQDTAAMIYLNSRERHAGGPLTTPRQIEDARIQASQVLSEALHPETGVRLFPRIVPVAEVSGVDPASEGFPDLIALPDEPYWVRTKLTSGSAWVEPDPNLPGTHRPEGVVSFFGPGVTPGRTLNANLVDIAPSVLAFLGLDLPSHLEGTPLPCLPRTPHRRADAPSEGIPRPHETHAGFEYTDEEQAILEQRLADLGYLE